MKKILLAVLAVICICALPLAVKSYATQDYYGLYLGSDSGYLTEDGGSAACGLKITYDEENRCASFGFNNSASNYSRVQMQFGASSLKNVVVKEYPYMALRIYTNVEDLYFFSRLHTTTDSTNYILWQGNEGSSTKDEDLKLKTGEWTTIFIDWTKAQYLDRNGLDSLGGTYKKASIVLGSGKQGSSLEGKITNVTEDSVFYVNSVAVFKDENACKAFTGYEMPEVNSGEYHGMYFGTQNSYVTTEGGGLMSECDTQNGYVSFTFNNSAENQNRAWINYTQSPLKDVVVKDFPFMAIRVYTNIENLYMYSRLHTTTDTSNYIWWQGNSGTSTADADRIIKANEWTTICIDWTKALYINAKSEDSLGGTYKKNSLALGSSAGTEYITNATADSVFYIDSVAVFQDLASCKAFKGYGQDTADYTTLNAKVAEAQGYLAKAEEYTKVSIYKLKASIDGIVYNRHVTEQSLVDEDVEKVSLAIAELKPVRTNVSSFDEDNVVIRAGIMTDVHIGLNEGSKYFDEALDYLKGYVGNNNLDMLLFGGDLIDTTYSTMDDSLIYEFKDILEENVDVSQTAVFYTLGNHDVFANDVKPLVKLYSDVFREGTDFSNEYFAYDVDKEAIPYGNRHAVYNGYHFISVQVEADYTCSENSLAWLDAKLKAITEENPNQYVFVLTHCAPYQTVYATEVDRYGAFNSNIDSVLKNYPQTVCLTGHFHNDLYIDSVVMQEDYTCVDIGGLNYVATQVFIDGNKVVPEKTQNNKDYCQFIYMEIDKAGCIRLTMLDAQNNRVIRVIELKTPDKDGYFLEDYTKYRSYEVQPLKFEEGATVSFEKTGARVASVNFPTAKGEGALVYELELKDVTTNKRVAVAYWYTSPFYYAEQFPNQMSGEMRNLTFTDKHEYVFTVTAYNEWLAECDTLTYNFTYVEPIDTSSAVLTLSQTEFTYEEGEVYEPTVTVTLNDQILVEEVDYTVSYVNNNKVGIAIATVSFKGNYGGTASATFFIKENIAQEPSVDNSSTGNENNPSEKGGCGAGMGVASLALSFATLASVLFIKKRKN